MTESEGTHPALIVITAVMSAFAIFIIIIYFKSKIFHSYPYYFNIFFILTILLNNLIRLIPKRLEENEFEISLQCYIQGICLTVLDKLMICLITCYSLIYFLGSFLGDFFEEHKMMTYLLLSEASFVISMVLAAVFSIPGMSVGSQYCYVKTRDDTKKIVDTIITTILLAINIFCTIRLLINLIKIRREASANNRNIESISYHTFRFSFNLVFNFAMFIYVILLINKKLDSIENFTKDMYYILLSLIGEVFFTVNTEVLKETKRILTCKPPEVDVDQIHEDNIKEMSDKNE